MYEIKNSELIKQDEIKYKLSKSKDFTDLIFIHKNSNDIYNLFNKPEQGIYRLLANKYEIITLENTTQIFNKQNGRIDKSLSLENDIITINNGIYTIAGISIYPALMGLNINKIKSDVYPDIYKYVSMMFSPYFNTIKDKKICIIKQIGPWEISNNKLNLYFQQEYFFNETGNKTKSLFIYNSYNNVSNDYNDVNNSTHFDYLVANEVNDPKIGKYIEDCDIIIIDKFQIVRTRSCIHSSIIFIIYSYIINNVLKNIKSGATLILQELGFNTLPQYQLLYLLFRTFDNVKWIKNKLSYIKSGTYILSNYNNTRCSSILDTFISDYSKLDNYFGKHLYSNYESDWCSKINTVVEPITDTIVLSIFKNTLDESFLKFMNKIKKYNNKRIKKYCKHVNFIISDVTVIEDNIKKYIVPRIKSKLLYNIDKSIKLIKSIGGEVNHMYVNNIINNNKIVLNMIPDIDKRLIPKIHLSRDSIYSVSKFEVAEKISNIIKKTFKINNIIDGTANIGGNTINFARHFTHVLSNEIEKETFENLSNNINVLKLHNVQLCNDDITKLFNNKKLMNNINYNQNTWGLFLDPPWSGIYYSLEAALDLYFGKTNVVDSIAALPVKYICMKVPKNFNFAYLFNVFDNIIIHKVISCYLIMIYKVSTA